MRRTWRPQPIVHQPLEVTMGSKFAAFTHQPDKQDRYIPGQVAYEDESILRAVYADGVRCHGRPLQTGSLGKQESLWSLCCRVTWKLSRRTGSQPGWNTG